MAEPRMIALLVDYNGLAPVSDQRAVLLAADIAADEVVTVAPMTAEDWFYRIREAFDAAGEGGTVAVTSLHHLGLTASDLLGNLGELVVRDLGLIVVDESIDTRSDASFLTAIGSVVGAIDVGGVVRTRALLASVTRDTKSPPKARFVFAEDYTKAVAATGTP